MTSPRSPLGRSLHRRPPLRPLVSILALALGASPAWGQGPYLVRDIETTGAPYYPPCILSSCGPPAPVFGAVLSQFTPLGDLLVFSANDRVHGFEPWVSDGTEAGTLMLGDLAPGEPSSEPSLVGAVGGRVLFWTNTPDGRSAAGRVAWVTDGTPAGTVPLAMPCGDGCDDRHGDASATFAGELFFQAWDGQKSHIVLYRTDGTAAGTHEVLDFLCPGGATFCLFSAGGMVVWEDSLLFVEGFAGDVSKIWRLASPEGTPQEIVIPCAITSQLVPVGSEFLFFGSCVGQNAVGSHLFASDGTPGGTRFVRLAGSGPPPAGTPYRYPGSLTRIGAVAYFVVDVREGGGRYELWRTDGTPAGTTRVADFETYPYLLGLGSRPLILGRGRPDGRSGLWTVNDGGGLELLLERPEGSLQSLSVAGDRAFFAATDPASGSEPWITDGTPAGTYLLGDVAPGPASSNPAGGGGEGAGFTAAGDRVYFAADDSQRAFELWAAPLAVVPPPPPSCIPTDQVLCLGNGRFRAEVAWRDFTGRTDAGRTIPLNEETGAFWFFSPTNFELMVKALDGRGVNGHYWIFWGALTNVEFTLTVTDTSTGATWTRHNSLGDFASGGDTTAFVGD